MPDGSYICVNCPREGFCREFGCFKGPGRTLIDADYAKVEAWVLRKFYEQVARYYQSGTPL